MDFKSMVSTAANMPQVQEILKNLKFPLGKQDVTRKAQESGADNNVMSILQRLPDRQFQSQSDLMNELNKIK